MHAPRPRRWQRALRTVPGNPPNPLRQGMRALPYRCSFDKRSVGRGPCAPPPIIGNFLAMSLRGGPQGRRGPDINRRVCRTHVPYAFGCNPYPHTLALPLGELSPKVTERACRGGRPCPPKLAGLTLPAEGSGPYEMSADRTLVGRGPCLPTVVPADSRPLSRPTAGALPRNRLASSATGGASAISPKFPLPAQKGRADRWPVRPQVRRKMVRKKRYYSSMASSHTAPMAAPPNRAASHGDIRSRRRGGAPWVRA